MRTMVLPESGEGEDAEVSIKVAYNVDGVRGLLKEGGVARRETVSKLVAAMGGTMESFYYAF